VFSLPWDWPAVQRIPATRRVFDMTDDWTRLMPDRSVRLRRYYEEIEAGADEIILVNPALGQYFPNRDLVVVRNAVHERHIRDAAVDPSDKTMVYLGTLTERFNASLILEVLGILDDWHLDLVGPCLYAGLGDRPAHELQRLLDLTDRVSWHGALPRESALQFVDHAAVGIIPNRRDQSAGQDSMKLYDYAARGRPIVSTSVLGGDASYTPPRTLLADDAVAFADAVIAVSEADSTAGDQRLWAIENTWASRWANWSAAVFGP
jgi:glycosyltransferase involved in cell wall biosynthesis